ncbi:polyprenyl synthetase family protein [Miltoncostaea marina]|uniref:polyprenyl synthetase family protein n=1 Tax=Miltoncostaea marina TaxID=2843215 RepID=UPI001C3D609D|nr:polyprenyl synthetase family protein [Miltoncostaea marina]
MAGPARATLASGGKRTRPRMVLACAGPAPGRAHGVVAAAAAVELMHMATLVHDDVIDGAPLRRGRPSVVGAHGRGRAVAVGDVLMAAAFREAARLCDPAAVRVLARATDELTRGELLQAAGRGDVGLGEEIYVERCLLKTGALLAAACHLGALAGGAPPEARRRLAAFGRHLGVAYQIVDDVLDLTGDAAVTGKPRGADLADGTMTLPVILALRLDPWLGPAVRAAAGDAGVRARLCDELAAHAGTRAAAERAAEHADAAHAALDDLAHDADAAALRALASRVLARADAVAVRAVA